MKKATDALLSDHKMIRKLLTDFRLENPRFGSLSKLLERVVLSHAWFEDEIFLPAFKNEPLLGKRYMDELYNEHKDIDYYIALIRKGPFAPTPVTESNLKQFRAILENHLQKEEDALFPLAETILDSAGMNKVSAELERRQHEALEWIEKRERAKV